MVKVGDAVGSLVGDAVGSLVGGGDFGGLGGGVVCDGIGVASGLGALVDTTPEESFVVTLCLLLVAFHAPIATAIHKTEVMATATATAS